MSNNRFNKPAPAQYQPREERNKKPDEIILTFNNCCVCNKAITTGYYATTKEGGTCGKKCWGNYKPKGVSDENFTRVSAFNGAIFSPR